MYARSSQHDANPVAFRGQGRAELLAVYAQLGERVGLIGQAAEERFVGVGMTHEAQVECRDPVALESELDHHADPIFMLAPAVAGVERQIAETVVDRPPPVDFDWQRIMRSMAD